jgi:DNA-3-methyladenine glycosylase II
VSQQLSVKVADVILQRFMDIYDGISPTPKQVIGTSHEKLRSIGLSNAKANYVRNVAQFAIDQGLQLDKLQAMSDDEIFAYVGVIKGVGKWTIHLLLMFILGREDIFIADDMGVQNAMAKLFSLDKSNRKKLRQQIIEIAEKWSPYRSYLNVHLWQWLNTRPRQRQ